MLFNTLDNEFTFDGYIIGRKREDYRISIDGISAKNITDIDTILAFAQLACDRSADDTKFTREQLWAWWD